MVRPRSDSPGALGYRMPAEWEPHAATWLSWPHNPDTWPGKFEPIPSVWAELVHVLAAGEQVNILAAPGPVTEQAKTLVGNLPSVTLFDIPTNDCWMRDHGPTFLMGEDLCSPAVVDWQYNAWGGKYPPFDLDNEVPRRIAQRLGRKCFIPGIVLEGGAIEVNGQGTLLTTEECLLNPNRNPQLSRAEIEQYLADYLGVVKVLWLERGIVGDDTDGHIDELARFVNPHTIVAAVENDPTDANYESLVNNFRRLKSFVDQAGRPLEIVPLPMPGAKYFNDQRLPASYLNFYVANGQVIVPQYEDPGDRLAVEILGRLFPDRKIVGLPALDLAWGLGAYHCITQQEPAR